MNECLNLDIEMDPICNMQRLHKRTTRIQIEREDAYKSCAVTVESIVYLKMKITQDERTQR